MTVCHLCKRPLDQPEDPLSADCGGDCLGCINEIEGRMTATEPSNGGGRVMDWQPIKAEWLRACGFKVDGPVALKVTRRYMLNGFEFVDVIDLNGYPWVCIEWRFDRETA
jgi:hypothetical protein